MSQTTQQLLLIATRNSGKLKEIRQLLAGLPVGLVGLDAFPGIPDIVEDGSTLHDNALIKARAAFDATGLPSLSDDSGLEVDALGGRPGVLSARFAGEKVSYADNNIKLLSELGEAPPASRTARFRCVAAFIDGKTEHVVAGICEGLIAERIRGTGGFGYDPLFIPQGYRESFAELPPDVKNKMSHRFDAFRQMSAFLSAYFNLSR